MKVWRKPPPNPPQSLDGHAVSVHGALYFSTQWRNGVVFTSRSEILCGALEECLASRLIHWLHSERMMSHAQKNMHMSRRKSHQANISAWLRRCNRDSRSSTRSATVIQGTCISQRFILDRPLFFFFFFFSQPHWYSCTININPTWEVSGPVAKASMGHPESKHQPFSVMSHGYKDFPTRIRSHDPSAAVEMLIWFGLWCEGVTNCCSPARRYCDWLSLQFELIMLESPGFKTEEI